jgi:curved DNA-binding protein CbpA
MTDANFGEIEAYFRVLGLEPGASAEAVKEAYRHYLQAFHPDKYPPDSAGQKWASEKLIQVKEANEKLVEFFRQYPDGQPPGGWSTKSTAGAGSAAPENSEESSQESVDWTAWEKQQASTFESELKAWEQREQKRQQESQKGKTYEDRKKVVFIGKFALVAIIAALWFGRGTNSAQESYTRQLEANSWREKAIYDAQTRGTSYSPFALTADQVRQKNDERAKAMTDRWKADDADKRESMFFLIALTGGAVWLFFGKKPKAFIESWVEGAAK